MSQIQGAMTSSISGGAVLPGGTTPATTFDAVLGQQIGATQPVAFRPGRHGRPADGRARPAGDRRHRAAARLQRRPRIAEYRQATAGSGIGPWCAYFTSWLAKSAGVPVGEQGQGFGSVDALYGWAQRTGRAVQNGPGVHPSPGDLIVWDEHIGVVESVDPDGTVHTIEGNSSNQVIRRTHDAGSALGYVRVG